MKSPGRPAFGASGLRAGRVRGGVDQANGLATMSLAFRQDTPHAAVEGLDGGVQDAACRVEVARAQGVRIAGQAGAGESQAIGGRRRRSSAGTWCGCMGSYSPSRRAER